MRRGRIKMERVQQVEEVRAWCAARRAAGRSIAFVPTMGYLHQGHLALMDVARREADDVIVSIFVNPTQFGPTEDLARYPKDFEGDLAKCDAAGVELVFTPAATAIYPAGHQTFIEVEQVSRGMCGERRPGHFRGVCTVVAQLFNIVGSCVAVFGEKDYQQLQVIRRMVQDLHFPVRLVGVPTVREPDGLAMSSRNAYLSAAHREVAANLYRILRLARAAVAEKALSRTDLEMLVRSELDPITEIRLDYIALRDAETLEPQAQGATGRSVLLVAAFVGETRLIDNIRL